MVDPETTKVSLHQISILSEKLLDFFLYYRYYDVY